MWVSARWQIKNASVTQDTGSAHLKPSAFCILRKCSMACVITRSSSALVSRCGICNAVCGVESLVFQHREDVSHLLSLGHDWVCNA